MIALADTGPVATLTLDRAGARNALRIGDWLAIADALAAVRARVIVLRSGVEGVFCAGADIDEMAAMATDTDARVRFREAMREGIDAVGNARVPVIALIEGGCFGAGVALAAAADIRVAGPRARFAIPPAKLGIGYPAEDVARIVGLVGRGQTARLLLGAQTIDVGEAARIGLVDLLADDADDLANAIAANAPEAVALLRRTIRGKGGTAEFDAAFARPEFAEGLAAFREKRKPCF